MSVLFIVLTGVAAVAIAAFAIGREVHKRRDVAMHRFALKVMSDPDDERPHKA